MSVELKSRVAQRTRVLTHWNGGAVDFVCISSKVSESLYSSLEVNKQCWQKRFPAVQRLNCLKREEGDV